MAPSIVQDVVASPEIKRSDVLAGVPLNVQRAFLDSRSCLLFLLELMSDFLCIKEILCF